MQYLGQCTVVSRLKFNPWEVLIEKGITHANQVKKKKKKACRVPAATQS